jgi:DNA-directed RNA polymerase beta' subunit
VASTLGSLCLEALRAPDGVTLAIAPASSDAIAARAPKPLTSGEMLDFRTLQPQPGGLFDYKVFGPGTVIDAPPPDLDAPARPPKTQFARLALAAPLVHPLALARAPTRLAVLAGWSLDEVEACRADPAKSRLGELARALEASAEGCALVLRELPVLPPDLRPLIRLDDDRWQTSPINELYRHVVRRNQRLAKALESGAADQIAAELAGTANALEHLFENEDCADRLDVHGTVLTSLRGLAGGTTALFDALVALASGAPVTGRLHRASAVLFALGFELAA